MDFRFESFSFLASKISKSTLNIQVGLWLRELMRNYPFEKVDIEKMQERKLQHLVNRAYKIPFYRERFLQSGLHPKDVRTVGDLKHLPVLKKNELREWVEYEYRKAPKRYEKWYRDGTSGSTGIPLTIYRPWNEQAYIIAKWLRELCVSGYRPFRDRVCCMVSPHRISGRDSILQRIGILQRHPVSYLLPPEEMVRAYNHFKPDLFYANKSQMVQMAEYAESRSLALHTPRIYACGAETVDANSRKLIQKAFGQEGYFETYGSVELGILGFQTAANNDFYHFCHDTNIFEFTDRELGDQTQRCYITDLHQFAFPLIRYDIGDRLQTDLVNGLPVIRSIRGRMDDWVVFKDGQRIPFHVFYEIMERRPEVRQFRVIQEQHTLIRLQIVKAPTAYAKELQKTLVADLKKELCAAIMDYEFEWVDELPPDPNGKLRMLISKVEQVSCQS